MEFWVAVEISVCRGNGRDDNTLTPNNVNRCINIAVRDAEWNNKFKRCCGQFIYQSRSFVDHIGQVPFLFHATFFYQNGWHGKK